MKHLTEAVKTSLAITPTNGVAGTDDIEGVTLDMQGFDAFRAVVVMGEITATAVTSVKVQQGDESDLSDAADLEDTGITIADDDDEKVFITDVIRPAKRYVRIYLDRGTANAVIAAAVYEQYHARIEPVTESSDVDTEETHVTPDEGTA